MSDTLLLGSGLAFGIAGWLLYFYERQRSRDYATDLSQLIHDYDLGREDLRRSLGWDEIDERIDREERRDHDRDRTLVEAGDR
jgi:hypothetical protein